MKDKSELIKISEISAEDQPEVELFKKAKEIIGRLEKGMEYSYEEISQDASWGDLFPPSKISIFLGPEQGSDPIYFQVSYVLQDSEEPLTINLSFNHKTGDLRWNILHSPKNPYLQKIKNYLIQGLLSNLDKIQLPQLQKAVANPNNKVVDNRKSGRGDQEIYNLRRTQIERREQSSEEKKIETFSTQEIFTTGLAVDLTTFESHSTIRKLDPSVQQKVIADLQKLKEHPSPQLTKLEPRNDLFAARVGKGDYFRAIFQFQDGSLKFIGVFPRKDVYSLKTLGKL